MTVAGRNVENLQKELESLQEDYTNHLQMEKQIFELAGRLVNLKIEKIDQNFVHTLAQLAGYCHADHGFIMQMSEDGTSFRMTHEWKPENLSSIKKELPDVQVSKLKRFETMRRELEVVRFSDVGELPADFIFERETFKRLNIRSMLAVPLASNDRFLGFLGLHGIQKRINWSDSDVSLLRMVSVLFSNAIERGRAERRFQASQQRLWAQYQNVPIPTYSWQKNEESFRLIDYNNAALDITNGKISDWIGIGLNEMYGDQPDIIEQMHRCFSERKVLVEEMDYTFKSTGKAHRLMTHYVFVPPDMVVVHTVDISGRFAAERALRRSEQRLRLLSSRLIRAQEYERSRLSKELHDQIGHDLVILKSRLSQLEKIGECTPVMMDNLSETKQYVDLIIENVRRISRDLIPSILEDIGLDASLHWLIENFQKQLPFRVQYQIDEIDELLIQDAQINVYRIFQEAVTNIVKYAKAQLVKITVKREKSDIIFEISDDGVGFDTDMLMKKDLPDAGMGLETMRERVIIFGGQFDIHSIIGKGTLIQFVFPINA